MSFGKGIANVGENLGLDMMQLESDIWDLKGDYAQAEAVRQKMANADYIFTGNISKAQENIDKYSASGSTLDKTMETAGYMTALWASETAGGSIGQSAMTIGNTAGQTFADIYREQGTDVPQWAVKLKAIGSGVIEDRVERFGGFFGSTGATNKLTASLMSKTKSGIGKALISMGMSANDEGLEEVAGYILNSFLDRGIDYLGELNDEDLKFAKKWDWNELAENYGFAFISTLITGGARDMSNIASYGLSNNMKFSDAVEEYGKLKEEGLNEENAKKDIEKLIKQEKDPVIKKALKNKLEKLEQGQTISDKFSNVLEQVKQGTPMEQAIEQNMSLPPVQQTAQETAQPVQRAVDLARDTLESTVQANAQYFKSDADRQKFLNYGKGIQAITEQAGNPVKVLLDTTVGGDGLITINNADGTRAILVNPSMSNQSMEETLVHELFHNVKNTDEFKQIGDTLDNFVKKFKIKDSQGNLITLDNAKKQLQERYENYYQQHGLDTSTLDIDEESHAFLLQKIIGDEKTLNNLTKQQPKIVQAIYDFVDRISMRLKGLDKQTANTIIDLRNKLGNALKNNGIEVADTIKNAVSQDATNKTQQHKEEQLKIIQETNPMFNDTSVGIRNVEDIKTFKECVENAEEDSAFVWGDYSKEDAERDLKRGKVTIYSSYPIKNGVFVSTSYQQAYEYAGHDPSKVHQRTVNLDSVAWINGDEGQYAKVKPKVDEVKQENNLIDRLANNLIVQNKLSENDIYDEARKQANREFKQVNTDEEIDALNNRISEIEKKITNAINNKQTTNTDNQGRTLSKQQQEYFKDSKVRDENGNLLTVYHGTPNGEFTVFDKDMIGSTTDEYGRGDYGSGFYFTNIKEGAESYAEGEKGKVIEAYLDLKNPLRVDLYQQTQKNISEYMRENHKNVLSMTEQDWKNVYDNSPLSEEEYEKASDVIDRFEDDYAFDNLENLEELGYDGVIAENMNQIVALRPEQIKRVDNTNPTSNPDIRYSQNTKNNNIWNNFLDQVDKQTGEKNRTYFKQGETKAKLPVNAKYSVSTDDYNKQASDLIDKANIPDTDKKNFKNSLKGIEFTQDMMTELKDTIKTMEENAKADYDAILDTNRKYSDTDGIRKKTYNKYKRQTKAYDNSSLQNAMNIIQPNYQGRRTKEQWLQIASQIGTEIADKTNNEVEQIAFRSFLEAQPNQKENLNRQGNKYVGFNSDDWVNTIYNAVKEQRAKPKVEKKVAPVKKEVKAPVQQAEEFTDRNAQDFDALMSEIDKLPVKEKVNEEKQINGNDNETSRTEQEGERKERSAYKTIGDSEFQNEISKETAEELSEYDKYIKDHNADEIQRGKDYIKSRGVKKATEILLNNADLDKLSVNKKTLFGRKRVALDDTIVGIELIKYYQQSTEKDADVKLAQVMMATAQALTEAGKIVQAGSLLNKLTPQGQAMNLVKSVNKLNEDIEKRKGVKITQNKDGSYTVTDKNGNDVTDKVPVFRVTKEMVKSVANSKNTKELFDNLSKVHKELGQQVPKTLTEQLDEWRYFSMLANPKTHIRNLIGNLAMGKVQGFKNKFVAGTIEDVVSKFNPKMERTTTLRNITKEAKEFARNDIQSEEVRQMLGIGTSKYDTPKKAVLENQKTFQNKYMQATFGKAFDINSALLEAEDTGEAKGLRWLGIGLVPNYESALGRYITANKWTPSKMTPEQLSKARDYAVRQSLEATFHQASTFASTLEQISKKGKVYKFFMDALIPFKKTPTNVAKTGFDYSPVSLVRAISTDAYKLHKGQITVNQYIDNLSKGLTGSGIAVVGFCLAQMGVLRASGDDDKNKEYYDEQQGKQPYSLKIGDKTYSLDWLAPAGIPLFIGAEAYNMKQQRKKEGGAEEEKTAFTKTLDKFTDLLNSTAKALNPMAEMSMISGLTDTFSKISQAGTDEGKNLQYFEQLGVNSLSSYVNQYFPTVLGQIARTIDPYERTTVSTKSGTIPKTFDQTKNQIMAKLPGVRQLLPVKTDVWGNDVLAEENPVKKTVNTFINPATVRKISNDSVDKGLNELFKQTGTKAILPTGFSKKITIDGKDYVLSGEDYQNYKKEYGQTSHKLLQDMMNTEEYKSLNDEEKAKAVKDVYSYANEKIRLDYAKKKNQELEKSSSYETIEQLQKAGASDTDIVSYMAKFGNIKADLDKEGKAISGSLKNKQQDWLLNSDMSDDAKKIIYENRIGADSSYENYEGNINTYLRYKTDLYKATEPSENENRSTKQIDKVNVLLDGDYTDDEMTALYKAVGDDDVFNKKFKGRTKAYLRYKSDLDKMKGDKQTANNNDKLRTLTRGGFSNSDIRDIYDTIASDNDEVYKALKKTDINMREYLRYKQADLKADRTDDGTLQGKAISGTAKAKKVAFINNMNITYEQKLLLMGSEYTMSNAERERVAYYINNLNMSMAEKKKVYSKMKGFTVYKDGRVTW